jgi:hypothetical protein
LLSSSWPSPSSCRRHRRHRRLLPPPSRDLFDCCVHVSDAPRSHSDAPPRHAHAWDVEGEGSYEGGGSCQEEEPLWSRRPVLLWRLAKNK